MKTVDINTILNPATKFGDLFPRASKEELKKIYLLYSKIYHPDVCDDPRAADAFAKITEFYNTALSMLESDTWEKTNYIEFHLTTGKTIQITYLYHRIFELGEYYVCRKNIIYVFDFSKKEYYNNIKKTVRYANEDMEKAFKPLLPHVIKEANTENQHIVVMDKPENVYPLRCLFENYFNLNVPDKHLAWIVSRLMNICCFLKYNELVSNGLDLDNLFVCPDEHSIHLYGGWWYTVREGNNLIGTTRDIFNIMPPKVKADKRASSITDIESVKALGRKYLQPSAPAPFKEFLNSGSSEDSFKEMKKWDDALLRSYGKRHFLKLNTNIDNIYK